MNRRLFSMIVWIAIGLASLGCNDSKRFSQLPVEVVNSLTLAGGNRGELEKVIANFQQDSLKLRAAYFLIANMSNKGSAHYELRDESMKKVDFDVFAYKNGKSLDSARALFEKNRGKSISYVYNGYMPDIEKISSDMLIEDINYAFEAWKLPWAKHLDFDTFCETILPHRVSQEPLQVWRKQTFENSKWIIDYAKKRGLTDVIEICSLVNDSLKRAYVYKHDEMNFIPKYLTLSELQAFGGGRCQDLNVVAGYWLRAIGIPVMLEYTPFWGNSNFGGHDWLSVLDETGKSVPFNASYDNPVRDSVPFGGAEMAKAYRISYAPQSESLAMLKGESEHIPAVFQAENIIDITAQYYKVSNVEIELDTVLNNTQHVYLGVLNGYSWKPVGWTQIKKGTNTVTFQDVGRSVVYIPLFFVDSKLIPCADPFFLDSTGAVRHLKSGTDTNLKFKVRDLYWLRPNTTCQLMYWKSNKWNLANGLQYINGNPKELAKVKSQMSIQFESVPINSLVRVVSIGYKLASDLGRPLVFNQDSNSKYWRY